MSNKKGLFTGLVLGSFLGVLFAPKSGKKLREDLKNSDSKLSDFARAMLAASKDASSEAKDFLHSEMVQDLLKKGKDKAGDLFAIAEEKGKELSQKAKDEITEIAKKAGSKAKEQAKTAKDKIFKKKK